MHVQGQSSRTGNTKHQKINSFMHTLPKANQIFEILQHVKKSIYPFEMITNNHKLMSKQQQPYVKESGDQRGNGQKFKPFLESVAAHFQKSWLIYDKFNNNCDQELFNQNIYSIEKLKNLKNIDYVTHVQYTKSFEKSQQNLLRFNSRFESGNLSMASFVQGVYYLLLHNDVNTSGYTSWFYFHVKAPIKGRYKFAILNYGKAGVMHNQGVKICVYESKHGWVRGGQNISCQFNRNFFRKGSYMNFNTLYFQYFFQEDNSEVYFSYNVPYTYNDLCCFLDKIEEDSLPFFKRKLAGTSLAGNRLEMLTIANFNLLNSGLDLPVVVIMARSHPGQTVSSWIMHQFIKFIISNDQQAVTLRNNFVFKLFPMLNPDGVIHGNYRCSLSGRDLNRRWNESNKQLFPEVHLVRNHIIEVSKRKTIKMILDLHGHTKKKKIFAYGCNNKIQPHRCRLFPYILSKLTNYFEFKFCNFCISRCKFGTARISLYNELKIPYIYTIQTSQFGTYEGHLSLKVFNQMAVSIAKSLFMLFRIRKNDKEFEKNAESFEKIQNQLMNDTNLLRVGGDKDSGSQSEPSVDNIKFERLAQLTKRKQMKIQNINRVVVTHHHQRLKSYANPSLSLQKIQKSTPVRPKTSQPQAKRYEDQKQKIVKPISTQKRSSNINRTATQRMRPSPKIEVGNYTTKSVPTKRRAQALNFINLSLSVFEQEKSTKKNYRTGPSLQDNFTNFNEILFHKLRMAPRNYFQFRRIK